MASRFAFDHIIIAVRDLDAAIADYRVLGFSVYYGGKHTHKATHNGLISLADGAYLELLAPVTGAPMVETIDSLAVGEGFAGYALLFADLAADATRLRAAGIDCSDPSDGHRTRADGERVRWQAINLAGTRSPFLIADVTPHLLRVPNEPDKINHENRVIGVTGLVVAVADLAVATAKYAALLAVAAGVGMTIDEAQSATFLLANCTLTLAQPTTADSALARHLVAFGETPYALQLRAGAGAKIGCLALGLAHGAQLEIVAEE